MDLATGRVGFPTENGFFNYTMDHLATWAGLGERRTARIVATLQGRGVSRRVPNPGTVEGWLLQKSFRDQDRFHHALRRSGTPWLA